MSKRFNNWILKDRAASYSIVVMFLGSIMFLTGHTDWAILNTLVAIWFKLPFPKTSAQKEEK